MHLSLCIRWHCVCSAALIFLTFYKADNTSVRNKSRFAFSLHSHLLMKYNLVVITSITLQRRSVISIKIHRECCAIVVNIKKATIIIIAVVLFSNSGTLFGKNCLNIQVCCYIDTMYEVLMVYTLYCFFLKQLFFLKNVM